MATFRVGPRIGSGGFGQVNHATEVSASGAIVRTGLARKTLLEKYRTDVDAVARFKREVRLLGELSHPHIIEVIGRNLSDDPPWFVMPLAESDLTKEIASGGRNDQNWVESTFLAVLAAVEYAHKMGTGVLHRDLKPENVLIVAGVPKVSDFGLGKRLDPNTINVTKVNSQLGTLPYMAPEQFRNAAGVGPAADVYSLGKMLGEMLTGQVPDVGAPPLDLYPERYRAFIERCTKQDQGDRYASAGDARAAFELLVGSRGASPATAPPSLSQLLAAWEELPEDEDDEIVEAILDLVLMRSADEEFYYRAVPRLPPMLVSQLVERHPTRFGEVVRSYNDHVSGQLPFEYCDVLANFYRSVFLEINDLTMKEMLLERLVELGPSHNRWHIGGVVVGMLGNLQPAEERMALQVLRRHPHQARWFGQYERPRSISPAVAALLDAAQ